MSSNEGHEVYEESNAEIQKKQLLRDTDAVSDIESGRKAESKRFVWICHILEGVRGDFFLVDALFLGIFPFYDSTSCFRHWINRNYLLYRN